MDAKTLSKLPLETLQSRLESAHDALDRLMTGEREVQVAVRDGRRTTYSEVDVPHLQRYIQALSQAIDRQRSGRPSHAPVYLEF